MTSISLDTINKELEEIEKLFVIYKRQYEITQTMMEKYKMKYKNLKRRFNIEQQLHSDIMEEIPLYLTYEYYNKKNQLLQKQKECLINDNEDTFIFKELKELYDQLEDKEKAKEKEKNMMEFNTNKYTSTGISKYFQKKNEYISKFENFQGELKQHLQDLEDINVKQEQTIMKIPAIQTKLNKMLNINNDKIILLNQIKSFRHVLVKYRDEIKDIYTRFRGHRNKHELKKELVSKDVKTICNIWALNAQAELLEPLKKNESLKSFAKFSNNNECDEDAQFPRYKNLEETKNPTDKDQYDSDAQIKIQDQMERLKNELDLWQTRYYNTQYELLAMINKKQKMELDQQAFVQKMAVSGDRPISKVAVKSKPQIKESEKERIFLKRKGTSSNTKAAITSEDKSRDLYENFLISAREDSHKKEKTLENVKEIMTTKTIINKDLDAISKKIMKSSKCEQDGENIDPISSVLHDDLYLTKTEVSNNLEAMRSKLVIVDKQVQEDKAKDKEINNNTETEKQNELFNRELIHRAPHCDDKKNFEPEIMEVLIPKIKPTKKLMR